MKKILIVLSSVYLYSANIAQQVNYVLEIVNLRALGTSCTEDEFAFGPDEEITWHCWARDNDQISSWTNDGPSDCYGGDGNVPVTISPVPTLLSGNNSLATTVSVRLEAWEDDDQNNMIGSVDRCDYDPVNTFPSNGDDCYSDQNQSISFRNQPACQWNSYTINSGDYRADVRLKWEYSNFTAIPASYATCGTQVQLNSTGNGSWSVVSGTGGAFSNQLDQNAIFSGNIGETYQIDWSVIPGCITAFPPQGVTINLNANPIPNLQTSSLLCENTTMNFTADNGISYIWSSGSLGNTLDTTVSGANTFLITQSNLPIYVSVTDGNGCIGIDSIDFALQPSPTMDLGNDTTICPGTSINLDATASGLNSYNWNVGGNSSFLTVSSSALYYCDVTSNNGCVFSDSINVGLFPTTSVNLGANVEFCLGDSVTLDAGAGFTTYTWHDASGNQTNTITNFGTVSVNVVDSNTCTAGDTITFSPVYTGYQLMNDTAIYLGNSIDLTATNGVAYSWSNGDTSQTISVSPTADSTYTVTVERSDGCFDVYTVNVLLNEGLNFFIPTMFSPNGDGSNDVFLVYGNGLSTVNFRIFNRWGDLVYETTDLTAIQSTGWDGKVNGKDQPTGTYLWTLEGTTINGDPLLFEDKNSGTIVLRR